MRRIGILGGASDQATAEYYRRLNQAANDRLGGWNTAELIISSMNFAFNRECALNGRWDELADYLSERAVALESAGAELLICASNTLHRVADQFTRQLSIPFLHIVDPTALAIRAAGLERAAFIGTKAATATNHIKSRYRDRFGIEIIVPDESDQDATDQIIFEELCRGRVEAGSRQVVLDIVDRLQERGAQGLILGCTEIPLLISQADRPQLPIFDTGELHVAAAIEFATRNG